MLFINYALHFVIALHCVVRIMMFALTGGGGGGVAVMVGCPWLMEEGWGRAVEEMSLRALPSDMNPMISVM